MKPIYSFIYFLNFIFTLFYFTILYWFCHTLTWIHHGCIRAPNPESPSHLPPHIISLDHPHAPAPSILYPVLNIDWHFVSYMIVYMFQCPFSQIIFKVDLATPSHYRTMFICQGKNTHIIPLWNKPSSNTTFSFFKPKEQYFLFIMSGFLIA